MNNLSIEFFSRYSLSTILIALVVSLISGILKLILKDKLSTFFTNFLPIILSIIFSIIVDVVLTQKKFAITENAIYLGFTSGSLSTLILVLVAKIKKGEKFTTDTLSLIIEGLISGYVKQENISNVVKSIKALIEEKDAKNQKERIEKDIKAILVNNLQEEISILELDSITNMIFGVILENTTNKN